MPISDIIQSVEAHAFEEHLDAWETAQHLAQWAERRAAELFERVKEVCPHPEFVGPRCTTCQQAARPCPHPSDLVDDWKWSRSNGYGSVHENTGSYCRGCQCRKYWKSESRWYTTAEWLSHGKRDDD